MIIFRYLLKEVAKTQLAVFFVLMTIFISQKFVSILGDAAEGGIPGHMVMLFIALKTPDLAGMMLPLSMFLGILLAYSRIYADSEMSILHACGISEWYVVRITIIVGIITAIITGIFTLYLSPIAVEHELQIKEKLAADSGLSSLIAGRFQKTGNNKAVVFIQNKDRKDNSLSKIFVAQLPDDNHSHDSIINSSLVYATSGKVEEQDSGSQRLILADGIRYQKDNQNGEFRSVAFDKYYIQIQDKKVTHKRRKISALPTNELFNFSQPEYSAAIHWRLAFPLAAIVLTFIAVPLSTVNPRQGKFAKLLPAILLFLGYFLMLSAMLSGLEKGVISNTVGLWPVHLAALVLGLSLIFKDRGGALKLRAKLSFLRRARGTA